MSQKVCNALAFLGEERKSFLYPTPIRSVLEELTSSWVSTPSLPFLSFLLFFFFFFFFGLFAFSRDAPAAYRGSQARGLIRAVATGLHRSYSNARSEPHLRPTPQLLATLDR